jgi:hypothetical protein
MSILASASKKTSNRWSVIITVCMIVYLFVLVLSLYTLTHEGGHALVGLLMGGKLTGFNANFYDLSAHVNIDGNFSLPQQALISVAGISLPVLLCMGFILLSSKKQEAILDWFKLVLFMVTVNSLLAWIVIPVLTMLGKTVSDDSVNFLNDTHFSPLLVTGVALLVYGMCWFLFLHRTGGFRNLVAQVKNIPFDQTWLAMRKTILSLAFLGAVSLAATIGLTQAFPDRSTVAPSGYQLVNELQLSKNGYNDQAVYQFMLKEPASVSFYFALNQVNGAPTTIHLTGPAGYDAVFFNVNDPKANITQASVNPKGITLAKGDYKVRVTFQPSPGSVKLYIKID